MWVRSGWTSTGTLQCSETLRNGPVIAQNQATNISLSCGKYGVYRLCVAPMMGWTDFIACECGRVHRRTSLLQPTTPWFVASARRSAPHSSDRSVRTFILKMAVGHRGHREHRGHGVRRDGRRVAQRARTTCGWLFRIRPPGEKHSSSKPAPTPWPLCSLWLQLPFLGSLKRS